MSCESGCISSGQCTTIASANLILQNVSYNPQPPSPNTVVTINATIYNDYPAATYARLCVFNTDNGTCIGSSDSIYFIPYGSSTFSIPIPLGASPLNVQVAAIQTRLPYVYDCGQYQNFTITPYYPPGALCDCTPTGCNQNPSGSMSCSSCQLTCKKGGGGFQCSGCDPAQNMCILGLCLPKPVVFIGLIAIVYSMMGRGEK